MAFRSIKEIKDPVDLVSSSAKLRRAIGAPSHFSPLIPTLEPFINFEERRISWPVGNEQVYSGVENFIYVLDGVASVETSNSTPSFAQVGDLNVVIAGQGTIEAECALKDKGTVRFIHVVTNLGVTLKNTFPSSSLYKNNSLPLHFKKLSPKSALSVKILVGSAFGYTSPVQCCNNTLFLDVNVENNQQGQDNVIDIHDVQNEDECFIYILKGSVLINETEMKSGMVAVFTCAKGEERIRINVKERYGVRFLLLSSSPHYERFFQRGGYVENSLEEVNKKMNEYRKKEGAFAIMKNYKSFYSTHCLEGINKSCYTPSNEWKHYEISHFKAGAGRKEGFKSIGEHSELAFEEKKDKMDYDEQITDRFLSVHHIHLKDTLKDL